MDLENICNEVKMLSIYTGAFIRNMHTSTNQSYKTKGKNDFVTTIDKQSEEKIVEGLSKILPSAGFIAEEQTVKQKTQEYMWVIDPIDGTTNFIHGLYPHAISIALLKNNKPVIGVIYEIGQNECFYTWKNAPAFCNGKEIFVSKNKTVEQSLIATGFPYYNFSKLKEFTNTLEYFMQNSQGIRRLGSAATDLAYIACGRFDAFYEYGLKPWDVAAGILLVEQAGGSVSAFSLEKNPIFDSEIIASNSHVFKEFSTIISSNLNI